MATSSKVQFKLATLQQKAMESINFRIDQALLHVRSFDDDAALSNRIAAWRVRQEDRISELFRSLGGDKVIGDHQLSKFKIEDIPSVDRYDRQKAEYHLRDLLSTRTRIEAKSGSLVADEDGNISLTKTQLHEFFGL